MRLVLACGAFLHRRLVRELARVHELGHRRTCAGRSLDEVEVCLGGQPECIVDTSDADLLAIGADEADLGYTDPVVDAGLGADAILLVINLVLVSCDGQNTTKAPGARTRRPSRGDRLTPLRRQPLVARPPGRSGPGTRQ